MTSTVAAARLSALLAAGLQNAPMVAPADERAVVWVKANIEQREIVASAVLVSREDGPSGVVLYFLTGEVPPQLTPDGEGGLGTGPSAPRIAVLRLMTAASPLAPARITLEPPQQGGLFFIVSHDAAGARVVTQQHVRGISEGYATGDVELRTAACVGAAALSDHGVFGIVAECEPNRPPVIALLSAATGLLRHLVPGLGLEPDGRRTVGRG